MELCSQNISFSQEQSWCSTKRFKDFVECLRAWQSYDFEKKCAQFSKYSCHELTFYLLNKDKVFFDEVAIAFVRNKLQKSFFDWYFLAMEGDQRYVDKVLSYNEDFTRYEALNHLEVCLLVDVCMRNG